jgi:hypothetical protein
VVQDYLVRRPSPGFGVTMTMAEAHNVQRGFVAGLEPELGKPVGYKVGLVSRAMQERFRTTQPVRGVLLEKMLVPDGAEVPAGFGTHMLLEADLIVTVKDKGIHKASTHLEGSSTSRKSSPSSNCPTPFSPRTCRWTPPCSPPPTSGHAWGCLASARR